jgi:hypothetical protein
MPPHRHSSAILVGFPVASLSTDKTPGRQPYPDFFLVEIGQYPAASVATWQQREEIIRAKPLSYLRIRPSQDMPVYKTFWDTTYRFKNAAHRDS